MKNGEATNKKIDILIKINKENKPIINSYVKKKTNIYLLFAEQPNKTIYCIIFFNMTQFFVQTDQEYYFGGDTISGMVYCVINTYLGGATGISLTFTGYQCVKWVQYTPLSKKKGKYVKPGFGFNRVVPTHKMHNANNIPQVSDVESQDNDSEDFRPKYVRCKGRAYKMTYFETRNTFSKSTCLIYQCQGLPPGQYSFPFTFKTFEGWPASFDYSSKYKKGKTIYSIMVAVQPTGPKSRHAVKHNHQVILRQTRPVNTQVVRKEGQVAYCCCFCCNSGKARVDVNLQKDGYMPSQLVQMIIDVDNSQCSSKISNIEISLINIVRLTSQGSSTTVQQQVMERKIAGVPANHKAVGDGANIRDSFPLNAKKVMAIKPSSSGKLISSQYVIRVRLHHQYGCNCCVKFVQAQIPVIIFPYVQPIMMPPVFQNNWEPQIMPMNNIQISNNFNNFNISNLPPIPIERDSDDEDNGPNQKMKPIPPNNGNYNNMPQQGVPPNFNNGPPNGQMGPGQMGPGQMGPGQMGPGQMGPGQMGPGQMGPGQMGPGQMGGVQPNMMNGNQGYQPNFGNQNMVGNQNDSDSDSNQSSNNQKLAKRDKPKKKRSKSKNKTSKAKTKNVQQIVRQESEYSSQLASNNPYKSKNHPLNIHQQRILQTPLMDQIDDNLIDSGSRNVMKKLNHATKKNNLNGMMNSLF